MRISDWSSDGCSSDLRGVGARVIGVARIAVIGQPPPIPDRLPGIAALDAAIEIVPVIEHPNRDSRRRRNIEIVEPRARLRQPQPGEGTVAQADIGIGGYPRHRPAAHRYPADPKALAPEDAAGPR